MMPILNWLYRHVFNSVPFGIAILVSIGLYVAIGSGIVSVREWLEMDEMLFFNWWPMKVLAALLVINLTVVTVSRIPLTLPRYGVWCIHMGIILLVLSLGAHYSRKTEGYVPLSKGQTTSDFYDRWERALYVRTQFSTNRGVPLEELPRFREYDESAGNASYLDRASLQNLQPQLTVIEQATGRRQRVTLGEALGLDQPVTLDVIGYFPYGQIERWKTDPSAKGTALRVRRADSNDPATAMWLVAERPVDAVVPIGPAAVEHRHLPLKADVDIATRSARQMHKLNIRVGDVTQDLHVEPGQTIDVGTTGYSVTIEGFTPQFALSSNDGTRADVLTVLITKKAADGKENTFRRTVLSETNVQTDFELNIEGAGPFGKRLREGLLDDAIQLGYRFSDPTKLLSSVAETTVKYVLFTCDDQPGLTMLRVSAREPSVVNQGSDEVHLHVTAPTPMFGGEPQGHTHGDHQDIADLVITRVNNVMPSDGVTVVPPDRRQRDVATSGRGQVVRVRVKAGEFEQIVAVPYDPFATQNTWASPRIQIPGANGDFQLMLGNLLRPLPMDVRLEKFEAIPYAGGDTSGRSIMRDFKSTITLFGRGENGAIQSSSASMNSPAFFRIPAPVWFVPGESWLLSQASWDPSNLDTTVLQIGNRPAVGMMTFACVLICAGLMYAFYAKPIIVRRMKSKALRDAMNRRNESQARPTDEKKLVESV